MKEITMVINVDSKGIDEAQEKANELKSTLVEVLNLISSLGGTITYPITINVERAKHDLEPLDNPLCDKPLVKCD